MPLAHLVEVVLGIAFVEPALFWQPRLPFVFEAFPAFPSWQGSPLESWQTSPNPLQKTFHGKNGHPSFNIY